MKAQIHVFRSKEKDTEEDTPTTGSITIRFIDKNLYAVIKLSIVDAGELLRDLKRAIDQER